MSQRQVLSTQADFTGGLNLRVTPFLLGDNECSDLRDVDLNPEGGVRQRFGVTRFGTDLPSQPYSFIHHVDSRYSALNQLLVICENGKMYRYTPTEWIEEASGIPVVAKWRFATINGKTYMVANGQTSRVWDGENLTTLGGTFNSNPENYTNANLPPAGVVSAFNGGAGNGFLWIARTTEGTAAVPHLSRVRWSFPSTANQASGPQDWHPEDYVDLDPGVGGDFITAIVPQVDRMVVFKRNSIHGIYGTLPASPYPQLIANQIGNINRETLAVVNNDIFFFSWPEGLHRLTPEGVQPLFEPLMPLIEDGHINPANRGLIAVGYHANRVYVSVPYGSTEVNNRTYVLDLITGAWTRYGYGVRAFYERVVNTENQFLGMAANENRVYRLDTSLTHDRWDGSTQTPINGWFRTRWFTNNRPFTVKQWKRPEYALRMGSSESMNVQVYHDFSTSSVARTHTVSTGTNGLTTIRGDLLGKAQAVSLRFNGPTNSLNQWQLGAFSLRHVNERNRF
jgi:hypothetical protein